MRRWRPLQRDVVHLVGCPSHGPCMQLSEVPKLHTPADILSNFQAFTVYRLFATRAAESRRKNLENGRILTPRRVEP